MGDVRTEKLDETRRAVKSVGQPGPGRAGAERARPASYVGSDTALRCAVYKHNTALQLS